MANITTFDSKDLIVTVNNVNITGLGEDGASGGKKTKRFSLHHTAYRATALSVLQTMTSAR